MVSAVAPCFASSRLNQDRFAFQFEVGESYGADLATVLVIVADQDTIQVGKGT